MSDDDVCQMERDVDDEINRRGVLSCPVCGDHPEIDHEWVFTFSGGTHPDTGQDLRWAYAVIPGSREAAAEHSRRMFSAAGMTVHAYPSRDAAGVERYGLVEVPWPSRADR